MQITRPRRPGRALLNVQIISGERLDGEEHKEEEEERKGRRRNNRGPRDAESPGWQPTP